MESYRKYSSRHHDSRHHKHHKHRHRHHHYRYEEDEHESHRVHQRHHNHRSSDDDDYEYNRVPSTRNTSPMHFQPTRRPATPPPPPPTPPPTSVPIVEKPRERNWKLMADPFFGKVTTKIYRYDGIVPNDSSYPEVILQDPRTYKSKNKTISLPIELTIPKFKVCIINY